MVTFRKAGKVGSIAFRRLPSKNRVDQSKGDQRSEFEEEQDHPGPSRQVQLQPFLYDFEKNLEQKEEATTFAGLRHKRFHPMHFNIGCVKGFKCCDDVRCKPFCSMCYGKLLQIRVGTPG